MAIFLSGSFLFFPAGEHMGKQLQHESSHGAINRERRGLVGGVVGFFDLHPLFHLRRFLLGRRQHRGGDAYGINYFKVKEDVPLAGEQHVSPDGQDEIKHAGDKVRVCDESGGVSASSKKMIRTLSIHHLECSDYVVKGGDDGSHEQSKASASSSKANSFQENNREADDNFSEDQKTPRKYQNEILASNDTKDPFRAQELYDAGEEIFRKILQDEDHISANYNQRFQNPDAALVPTRSGSFPRLGSSLNSTSFSKLKPIVDDTYPSLRQEDESQSSNLKSSMKCQNGIPGADSRSVDGDMPSSSSKFSSVSFHNLNAQTIDGMDRENKKEKYRISMDSVLHRLPYGKKVPQTMRLEKKSFTERLTPYLKKSSSLTESMERYSLLLESNFSKESNNHTFQRSKSVREAGPFPAMNRSQTLGHVHSLQEFEPYFSRKDALCETSHVSSSKSLPVNSKRINSSNEIVVLDEGGSLGVVNTGEESEKRDVVDDQNPGHASENNVLPTNIVVEPTISCTKGSAHEKFECYNKTSEIRNECDSLHDDPESALQHCCNDEETNLNQVSDVKSQLEDDLTTAENYILPEENTVKITECIASAVVQSSGNLETREIDKKSCTVSSGYDPICVKIDSKDEAEFDFVKELLSKSGFNGRELTKAWNSAEQPVDFSLFEEVEGSKCRLDFGLYAPDINLGHLLLFDLINEVILETYSSALNPWLSCFSSGVQRISVGSRILEEVWAKVCWHRSYWSQPDPSLEYVLDRDLSKNDGWMDIRYETEYLGQELASLILDDLLVDATSQ